MSGKLIENIYEAALVPDLWPSVLDQLSELTGSIGGAVLTRGRRHPPRWAASAPVAPALHAFASGEAWKYNKRAQRWISSGHAGFSRDVDLFTDEELRDDRMAAELHTHGLGWQLGTVIPMTSGEVVVFSLERRLADGAHDAAMRDIADPYRPHLARAGLLAARLGLHRAKTAVATLEAIGLPAVVTDAAGRVVAANGLVHRGEVFAPAAHGHFALSDPMADTLLKETIVSAVAGRLVARSIPMAGDGKRPAAIIHVLPLSGTAHDVFSNASVLVVATALDMSAKLPDLALLQGLFDLSPMEAKIAKGLCAGLALKQVAEEAEIQLSTARSYLEAIFRKTGAHQQSQLVALLKSTQPMVR